MNTKNRAEIVERYRALRAINVRHQSDALKLISIPALEALAKRWA